MPGVHGRSYFLSGREGRLFLCMAETAQSKFPLPNPFGNLVIEINNSHSPFQAQAIAWKIMSVLILGDMLLH